MKDEILKQLMDDLESYYLPNQLTNDLAVYYPPSIDGMESIEDIIKESSNSDLQLRLIALKEFILNEKQTDANLYRPLYNDEFGDIELDIIEHYIKTDAKLDPEHAKVLNRIAELIGFKYTAPKKRKYTVTQRVTVPKKREYTVTQRVTHLTAPYMGMTAASASVGYLNNITL